jgi:hypothetical protein
MSADDPSDRFAARPPLDDVVGQLLTVEQFLHQRPRSELILGTSVRSRRHRYETIAWCRN